MISHFPLTIPAEQQNKRDKRNARDRERYRIDPEFRLIAILRQRLRNVAKRGRGYSGDNLAWLGCSPSQLIAHLEQQFQRGMNWSNLGIGEGCWHIDHRRPCASFDLSRQEQVAKCFHFTNLQPLWVTHNLNKGSAWRRTPFKYRASEYRSERIVRLNKSRNTSVVN